MSINAQMDKQMWYKHAIDYAIKRNAVLTPATTWMTLENVVLSDRSQSKKATYYDSIHVEVQNKEI